MGQDATGQHLYLLDQAFAGDGWHSLLTNLRAASEADWTWVPPGGSRSIRDVIRHVGGTKYMYQNHAFGDASLTWDHPLVDGFGALDDAAAAEVWLDAAQRLLRASVAALDDADLARARPTNWGELRETRWIIGVLVAHDCYHAGEINHLRSLHQADDGWEYERASEQATPSA